MKKGLIISILFFVCAGVTKAQLKGTYNVKGADTMKVFKPTPNAFGTGTELQLLNGTKDVLGFLYNIGNGITQFKKALVKINDSTYIIGVDTLKIKFPAITPLSLAAIGTVPNTKGASLSGNVLNLQPTDSTLHRGGVVSDTTQYFRGEKGIVSYTDLLFEAYSAGILRTILGSGGGQTWFLNDGVNEVGRLKYTTPVGTPGIGLYNTSGTGRSQIRQYASTGGLAFGAEAGSGAFAGNQIVMLPNGHTFIQPAGAGNVTDLTYLFNVAGSAKIDNTVLLPHYANNVAGDSTLTTDVNGLVKFKLASVIKFTPANSTDATFPNGTVATDDTFMYYRKSDGTWVKIAWTTF